MNPNCTSNVGLKTLTACTMGAQSVQGSFLMFHKAVQHAGSLIVETEKPEDGNHAPT